MAISLLLFSSQPTKSVGSSKREQQSKKRRLEQARTTLERHQTTASKKEIIMTNQYNTIDTKNPETFLKGTKP